MFFKMFDGFDVYRDWKSIYRNAEDPIYLPFTFEHEALEFPQHISIAFLDVLSTIRGGGLPKDVNEFKAQVELWEGIFGG